MYQLVVGSSQIDIGNYVVPTVFHFILQVDYVPAHDCVGGCSICARSHLQFVLFVTKIW